MNRIKAVAAAIMLCALIFCSAAWGGGVSPPQAWGDPDWEKRQNPELYHPETIVRRGENRSPVAKREREIIRELVLIEESGNAEAYMEPDPYEVELLACGIYQEAGGDDQSDLCRKYVGDVMLNRVNDPRFPNTLAGVLLQPGQYGSFSLTGVVWPARAAGEPEAVERAYQTARGLLSGEHSELFGAGYIWQAEFPQGTDIVYLDGIYFGK